MTVHGAWAYQRKTCHEGFDGKPCDLCREAHNAYQRAQRLLRYEKLRADPTIRPHGSYVTYVQWGCRCNPCSVAQSERQRKQSGRDELSVLTRRPFRRQPAAKPFGREWLYDSVHA